MSLHDTPQEDRILLKVGITTYYKILYESMQRRRSPNVVTDELVNEALDRAVSTARIAETVALFAQEAGLDVTETPVVIPESESDRTLDGMKRAYIFQVLNERNGNISDAARVLGVHRASLQRILRRFGVDPATAGRKVADPEPQPAASPMPPTPVVELCEHGNPVTACRKTATCFERAENKQGQPPAFGPACELARGTRCRNPLFWRGKARCGCPVPTRRAA